MATRYTFEDDCAGCCGCCMANDDNGPYVDHEAYAKLVAALKAMVEHSSERPFPSDRCQSCGWPLSKTEREGGCTKESCSFRPSEQTEQWRSLQKRRAWLEASKALREAGEL